MTHGVVCRAIGNSLETIYNYQQFLFQDTFNPEQTDVTRKSYTDGHKKTGLVNDAFDGVIEPSTENNGVSCLIINLVQNLVAN